MATFEQRFKYEPVELGADELIIHLIALMYNTTAHDDWEAGSAQPIIARLVPWLSVRRDVDAHAQRTHDVMPMDRTTERLLRRRASRILGTPTLVEHHTVNNQPPLFKPCQLVPARAAQREPSNRAQPEDRH